MTCVTFVTEVGALEDRTRLVTCSTFDQNLTAKMLLTRGSLDLFANSFFYRSLASFQKYPPTVLRIEITVLPSCQTMWCLLVSLSQGWNIRCMDM